MSTPTDTSEDPRRQVNVKINLNALLIHPAIEPGVIDNAMLTKCILADGEYLFSVICINTSVPLLVTHTALFS